MSSISNNGYKATCIEYNAANDIVVEFDDHNIKLHTQWNQFVNNRFSFPINKYGGIKDLMCIDETGRACKEYETWFSMYKRCYSESVLNKRPTYINKTVCEEWILYSNFLKWIKSQPNYDKWFNSDNWSLDKDILQKGNTVYSPDKCCLVPTYVNTLFIKCDSARGKYPVGVYCRKESGRFKAQCRDPFTNKYVCIGTFDTPEEAFYAYKTYKEDIIKAVAEKEYKANNITKPCYEAMMKYEVEITD